MLSVLEKLKILGAINENLRKSPQKTAINDL